MHDACPLFFDCDAKLLNVLRIFDNFGPTGCQIVECFSTFDNLGLIGNQIVGCTSPIQQFWPPRSAFLLNPRLAFLIERDEVSSYRIMSVSDKCFLSLEIV